MESVDCPSLSLDGCEALPRRRREFIIGGYMKMTRAPRKEKRKIRFATSFVVGVRVIYIVPEDWIFRKNLAFRSSSSSRGRGGGGGTS
eukprot:scaffold4052_cov213-Amphora_coffeaeformis.AAC.16